MVTLLITIYRRCRNYRLLRLILLTIVPDVDVAVTNATVVGFPVGVIDWFVRARITEAPKVSRRPCLCTAGLAEENPYSVAHPTDLLVQIPGPQGTTGAKADQKGGQSHDFRYNHTHHQKDRVANGENTIQHPKDAIQQTGAHIGWSQGLGDAIEQLGGKMTQTQSHHFTGENSHQCRNAYQDGKSQAHGRAGLATMRILPFVPPIGVHGWAICLRIDRCSIIFPPRAVGRLLDVVLVAVSREWDRGSRRNLVVLGVFVNGPPRIS